MCARRPVRDDFGDFADLIEFLRPLPQTLAWAAAIALVMAVGFGFPG